MKQKNLDYEPGFWLTVLIILPAIVAVEVILFFERRKR
jgi:hypothetical protein